MPKKAIYFKFTSKIDVGLVKQQIPGLGNEAGDVFFIVFWRSICHIWYFGFEQFLPIYM